MAHLFPRGAPVPPPDDRLDGGPRRGVARRRQARSSGRTTRRTTPCCRSSATVDPAAGPGVGGAVLRRRSRPTPRIPPLPDLSLPRALGEERREIVEDRVPLPRVYFGVPRAGLRRPPARRARHRRPDPRRRQGQPPPSRGSSARSGSPRTSRCSRCRFIGGASIAAGWATVRPGVDSRRVEAAYLEELERLAPRAADRRRARAREGADRGRRARARWRGSRSAPTGSRCTRRCSTTRASSTACCRATCP